MKHLAVVVLLGLGLTACSSVPPTYEASPSRSFSQPELTALGRAIEPDVARNPGRSGFRLLETGAEAYRSRAALAALAERTIDAQYFIWNSDTMGRLLGGMLLEAAERGVRVRLLVDDFYVGGRDRRIAMFNAHPNIQVRVFNPVTTRGSAVSRMLGFVAGFRRLNHRMHNKLFLVDGAFGVAGGRNVGDEYFGVHAEYNMRDRDVLAAGPVIAEFGASFDSYWNSRWAVPFEVLADDGMDAVEAKRQRDAMLDYARNPPPLPFPVHFTDAQLRGAVKQVVAELIWAEAKVHFDPPESSDDAPAGSNFTRVGKVLAEFVSAASSELLIQTPYLIPRDEGIALVGQMIRRGTTVKIQTNSLASTDMVPAQAVYARLRPQLLALGASVFELRPDAEVGKRFIFAKASPAPVLALHAKTIVADRRALYVGTYNLDRRSASLNTEIALIIRSPELARRVAEAIETDMAPGNSWQVVRSDQGGSVWLEPGAGGGRRYTDPPQAGFGLRLKAALIGIMPIDEQL